MSGWPPLPPDDAELEELLSEHVESITPPPALVAQTQRAVQRQVQPAAGAARWVAAGGALLALLVVVWISLPGEAPAPTPPPSTPTPAPSDEVTPTPPPPTSPALPPPPPPTVPPKELVIPLTGRPAQIQADENYDILEKQLAAPLIVTGRIEVTPGKADQASLRVTKVLRGKRAALLKVQASASANACMGVPDFTRFDGREVVLFLRLNKDGSATLLAGAASLKALPYHGYLGQAELGSLAVTQTIPGPRLAAVVKRKGPRALVWLGQHLRAAAKSTRAPAVQAALSSALLSLPAQPQRKDVMGIAGHFVGRPALSPVLLDRLKRYHATFLHRLGRYVRLPSGEWVNNGHPQHLTFLRFVGRFDGTWARRQVKDTLRRIERSSGARTQALYRAALGSLVETPELSDRLQVTLKNRPEGGAVLDLNGAAPGYPAGTLLHVSLSTPPANPGRDVELAFFMVRVDKGAFRARKVYKTQALAPLSYRVTIDLILSSQRRAVREWIRRDRGLPRNARVTLARKDLAIGTAAEQQRFRVQTLVDLDGFAQAFAKHHAAIDALVRSKAADPLGTARKQLRQTVDRYRDYLAKYVGWHEAFLIQNLSSAGANLERALSRFEKGQQARAEGAVAGAALRLQTAKQEIDRRREGK